MQNDTGYNGLTALTPGLPAEAYHDPKQFELEMRRIWQRNWVYVGRSSSLPKARSYLTFELGNQRLLLIRDEAAEVKGFFNTCRHRGALLCTEEQGTLRSGSLVCPYHAWVYGLDGSLTRTSSKITQEGFDATNYSLYPIHVREWRGFIFVALTDSPPAFSAMWDTPLDTLDRWPLEDLEIGQVMHRRIACNWKTYLENYNECLHCPSVHPQLSSLVPIYGRGLLEERDDPQWKSHASDPDPRWKGGVRTGATTWSRDGRASGRVFTDLNDEDRKVGYTYMTGVPSCVIAGHVDYVRVMRLLPVGPELMDMRVEYLFARETLQDRSVDIRNAVDFTNTVLNEDADVCEITQKGLHAAPHSRGVLMPEEYLIKRFHRWIADELARI